MGLLSLLTLPVSGPVRGATWVLSQIAAEAEAELYDEDRLRRQLAELQAAYELGEMDAATHAAEEEALLERIIEARRRSTPVDPTAADAPPPTEGTSSA